MQESQERDFRVLGFKPQASPIPASEIRRARGELSLTGFFCERAPEQGSQIRKEEKANTPGRFWKAAPQTEQFFSGYGSTSGQWHHPWGPSHLCPRGPPYFRWAPKYPEGHLSLTSGTLCSLLIGHPRLPLTLASVPCLFGPSATPGSGLSVQETLRSEGV